MPPEGAANGRLDKGAAALARELDALHGRSGKPVVTAGSGTDTLPGVHARPPETWLEQREVEFLRRIPGAAAARPFVAGVQVRNFLGLKTGQSTGRAAGMDLKGALTRNRRPETAAHFLRSRWAGG